MSVRAYLWQRGTSVLLLALVIVHLAIIFYATGKPLTAGDLLARTKGSVAWSLFYGSFVLAAAIHASIGVQATLVEWGSLRRRVAILWGTCLGALLLVLGFQAILAVVL